MEANLRVEHRNMTVGSFMEFVCPCGNVLKLGELPGAGENWELNIVGVLEARCKRCGEVTRTPGLWEIAQEGESHAIIRRR